MGKISFTETHFTTGILLEVLERYVVRTRLLPCDRNALGDLNSKEFFDSKKAAILLDRLVEKANGRLDIYEPTTALVNDLITIHTFPNNSEFLGMADQINVLALPQYLQNTKGVEFLSKNDIYLLVFRNYSMLSGAEDQISLLVLHSLGNKISRQLKNCYELIPSTLVDSVCSYCMDVFRTDSVRQIIGKTRERGLRLSKYTVDELFGKFSEYFDEAFDGKLLKQLKQLLNVYNMTKPIRSNEEFYETVQMKFVMMIEGVSALVDKFPNVFQPYSHPQNRLKQHYAVVRVFLDADDKFFIAKDLEYALNIALKNKTKSKLPAGLIKLELPEEKKSGILNSVSWEEFLKILETLKLSIEDLNIIEHKIRRTTRQIAVSLISQYGTHCKLASDAFFEVFENVSTGLRLFQTVSKANLPKVFEWFADLHGVFNDSKEGRYFVETWKIDQIIDRVYKELNDYAVGRAYDLPNKFNIGFTKEQVIQEINRFSPNFKLDQEHIASMHFKIINNYAMTNLTPRFIHQIYEHCVRLEFLARNPRFAKFIHNQGICRIYQRFVCECANEEDFVMASETTKNLEILSAKNVEANHIKFKDGYKYSLVAENGTKYYDNETCFYMALDRTLDHMDSNNQELLGLTYKAQCLKQEMNPILMRDSIFYLTEEEVHQFCNEIRQFYDDSIKIATARGEAQKASVTQTYEMDWEEVWKSFRAYFPGSETSAEVGAMFECVKRNLKRRQNATKKGLVGSFATQLTSICRHGQLTFQRCAERLKNLKDFMTKDEKYRNRRIILRMMSEMRIQDNKLWHMFTTEVFKAMKIVLRIEKRLHLMSDRIEKWEIDWYDSEHYTVMGVAGLEPMLRVLGIDMDKFLIVPDIHFTKNMAELPLKMNYDTVSVLAPNTELAYHYTQAQFRVFQFIACDINWNVASLDCCKHANSTNDFKKEVKNQMRNLKNGYVSANEVEGVMRRLADDDTYYAGRHRDLRTPLNLLHGKRYNETMTKHEFLKLVLEVCNDPIPISMAFHSHQLTQALAYEDLNDRDEYEVWRIKYVFMDHWIDWVLDEEEDESLKMDVQTAWTVCLGHLKISSFSELKRWRMSVGEVCNDYTDLKLLNNCLKIVKKNEEFNAKFKEDDLVIKHHWDRTQHKKKTNYTTHSHSHSHSNSSCSTTNTKAQSSTPAKSEKEKPKDSEKTEFSTLKRGFFNKPAAALKKPVETPKKVEKKKKTVEEVLDKLHDNLPKLLGYICDDDFEPMEMLEELIEEHLKGVLDDEDFDCLTLIMQENSELKKLEKKLEKYLDFKIDGGDHYFKRKRCASCSSSEESEEEEEDEEARGGGLQQHLERMFKRLSDAKKAEAEKVKNQKKEKSTPVKRKEFPIKNIVSQAATQKPAAEPAPAPTAPVAPPPPQQIIKKIVTETKIVETCEKCRDINQETAVNSRKIESLERRIGEFEKLVQNKDADIGVMKSQIAENKKKYRDEIQNQKEEITNRDSKIQQLQQELKEVCEDLRTERESLYTEAEENSKLANENKNKTRQLEEMKKENEQLKLRIQIFEENRENQTELLEKDQKIKELEEKLEELENSKKLEEEKNELLESFEKRMIDLQEQNFVSAENYEKELEEKMFYIQSIEERLAKYESIYDENQRANQYIQPNPHSQLFTAADYLEHRKMQEKLEEFEHILNFDKDQLIASVEKMVQKFIEKCGNPQEILNARAEFSNFIRKYNIYRIIIEEEYEKICQNPELRFEDLRVPDFPQPFSSGFAEKYEEVLKKWEEKEMNYEVEEKIYYGEEEGGRELEDKECLICATDVRPHQHFTKCTNCCRKYHSKCVSEWLKMNSICPVCRSSLPDPQEFPKL
ncbi:unnamed protein product [Caenorhabditis angaria]|uniref:RING-type domain-containing protein n=1 Tax=Caenorhabditis angaria TaxID=860376 RepID=A0A9P1MTV3_9PELO|nr:unnamed protein product [Caenorhabditis angaria]